MKCDELEEMVLEDGIGQMWKCYNVDEVDSAIAELKQKLSEKESWVKMLGEGESALSLELEKTKQKLENVQASHYAEMVDAGMRERRLRRALWLARALRARDIQRWWLSATCAPITERACRIWYNVERKCRAKAEEYK